LRAAEQHNNPHRSNQRPRHDASVGDSEIAFNAGRTLT
jgi:hypothetical protein